MFCLKTILYLLDMAKSEGLARKQCKEYVFHAKIVEVPIRWDWHIANIHRDCLRIAEREDDLHTMYFSLLIQKYFKTFCLEEPRCFDASRAKSSRM